MNKPKRRYEMALTVGADDLPSLRSIVNSLLYDLETLQDDMPYWSISGGFSGNHNLDVKFYPEVTHESWEQELEEYLKTQCDNQK